MLVRAIALLGAGVLGGCVSGPREYDYSVDIRNASDRPVTMEVLKIERANVGKVRADLAPGGSYVSKFTAYDSEYLEARLRVMGEAADAPYFICEIPQGRSRRDIEFKDGRLVLVARAARVAASR
jgi:hypothetical protein